ncbi:MAG: hypothetical protein HYX84_04415 [Chloroflexi bacterium]|nr:hypothetical protein [Chloroflexota bacterium]
MRERSWIVRAIYQCPEKVGLLLASTWLYELDPAADYCSYYPHYPIETINKN